LDDNPEIKSDMVRPLKGNFLKEQKIWLLMQFCANTSTNSSVLDVCEEEDRPFNPQLLLATAVVSNCGVDNAFMQLPLQVLALNHLHHDHLPKVCEGKASRCVQRSCAILSPPP
jgi:hypothetical protein